MVYGRFTIAARKKFTLFAEDRAMRTGKLSISRGYEVGASAPPGPRLVLVPKEVSPPPPRGPAPAAAASKASVSVSPEYQPAHDRLAALERLARLAKQGALTEEEFVFEKTRILSYPHGELVLEHPAPTPAGPSLAGRLFDWRLIPVGLAAGLGLSFASQPQETMRFFDDALRLLGL